jgi:hypothetical protein
MPTTNLKSLRKRAGIKTSLDLTTSLAGIK